jgi:Tfp pilus assembly protein PilV
MNTARRHNHHLTGATLIEAVIAVGVLAVAVPLVFGTIAEAGKGGQSAEAETRAPWMVRTCMEEIQASRDGKPQYFTATTTGQPFPPAGDVWALAFSADGKPVGKLSKSLYERGSKELDGKPVRYIAVISATTQPPVANTTPMLKSRVSIEYPATVPAKKRNKLDFHTRIP